jgi:hypothetical protein
MICGGGKKNKKSVAAQYTYTTKLADDRTTSPLRMNRDIIWHVLYDTDMELIRDLTLPAAKCAETDSSGSSEIVSYVEMCKNLTAMRVLFFIVLNVNEQLRADVCSRPFCDSVWSYHGKPAPFDGHKATRFFQDVEESCIHSWMRNEQCTATAMVENLRILYTCS